MKDLDEARVGIIAYLTWYSEKKALIPLLTDEIHEIAEGLSFIGYRKTGMDLNCLLESVRRVPLTEADVLRIYHNVKRRTGLSVYCLCDTDFLSLSNDERADYVKHMFDRNIPWLQEQL